MDWCAYRHSCIPHQYLAFPTYFASILHTSRQYPLSHNGVWRNHLILVVSLFFASLPFCSLNCTFSLQIKYLRVPDTLLDAVKEEQNRAREAGRSARGAHVSGAGPRGRGAPPRGQYFLSAPTWTIDQCIHVGRGMVRGAGGPIRGGRGRGRGM